MKADDCLDYVVIPVDQPDVVAGASAWLRPGHFKGGTNVADMAVPTGESSTNGNAPLPGDEIGDPPACMNADMMREHMEVLDVERKKIWGDDSNFWCMLHPLFTSPLATERRTRLLY